MFTLRPTKVLASRLGIHLPAVAKPVTRPFADWCVHRFRAERFEYLVFVNSVSLLSVVTHARGVTDDSTLIERLVSTLREYCRFSGRDLQFEQLIAPETACVDFAPIGGRPLLSSINELVFHAGYHLQAGDPPIEVSNRLNEIPMKFVEMDSPGKAFAEMAATSTAVPPAAAAEDKDDVIPFDASEADPSPVAGSEAEQHERYVANRRASLRRAAELVAVELAAFPFVTRILLFGSVAEPAKMETPRWRRLRAEVRQVSHDPKDVDLAVWVTDLSQLHLLRRAAGRAIGQHEKEIQTHLWPGVAHHQVDVFLLEPGTDRFRGNLCHFGQCPKGKPECHVTGCGAQPFLQLFEDFRFEGRGLRSPNAVVLFERKPAAFG
jgi:hypothetical protein